MSAERYPICPGPRCFLRVLPGRIFCAICWECIPGEIRDRIAEYWAPEGKSAACRRAVDEAKASLGLTA